MLQYLTSHRPGPLSLACAVVATVCTALAIWESDSNLYTVGVIVAMIVILYWCGSNDHSLLAAWVVAPVLAIAAISFFGGDLLAADGTVFWVAFGMLVLSAAGYATDRRRDSHRHPHRRNQVHAV